MKIWIIDYFEDQYVRLVWFNRFRIELYRCSGRADNGLISTKYKIGFSIPRTRVWTQSVDVEILRHTLYIIYIRI